MLMWHRRINQYLVVIVLWVYSSAVFEIINWTKGGWMSAQISVE